MLPIQPKILIVDDKVENLFSLEKLLQRLDVKVIQAQSGFDALRLTLEHEFCMAIVDVQMPEMDGYELVELLRGNQSTETLPVIFVSAIYSDEYHHRKAYDAGAVDFLQKPLQPNIFLSKVQVFLDLYHQKIRLQGLVQELNAANSDLSQRALQLETSAQVSHQITSLLDLDILLPQVVNLIQTRFNYYFVGVWLVDLKQATLYAGSHQQGEKAFNAEMSILLSDDQFIVSRVCKELHVQIGDGVCKERIFTENQPFSGHFSELGVPLIFGKNLIGVLHILRKQNTFIAEDITVLQTLADQIAIAIRNAQLYTGLEDKVKARTSELEKAYQHLEMLDRNKSEFIQVVSHELRTPLTLIKGFSQLMLAETEIPGNDAYRQEIQGIVNGTERMQDIVNSMLDMVKIDSQKLKLTLKKFSLHELMTKLRRTLDPALRSRNLTLSIEKLDCLPEIEADREAIEKLFTHLLSNAIKYTPDGGDITVSGNVVNNTSGAHSNKFVEISVKDKGIGIDPSVQELIFSKMYRATDVSFHSSGKTKFKGGGPGLGLAISRGIVEAHGGHIWVESSGYDEKLCPGSDFHIVLPIHQDIKTPNDLQKMLRYLRRDNAATYYTE